MRKEIWKDIEGFEKLYQVSNLGRVKSLHREIVMVSVKGKFYKRTFKGEYIKPSLDRYGYYKIKISKNCKRTHTTVHRLVAKAFIENPENKCCVNHIDGDKTNNYVENLEWVSNNENMKHAVKINLIKRGSENPRSKIKNYQAREIKIYLKYGFSIKTISEILKISSFIIKDISSNKTWRHIKI